MRIRVYTLDLGACLYKRPPCTLVNDPRESNKIVYSLILVSSCLFNSLLYIIRNLSGISSTTRSSSPRAQNPEVKILNPISIIFQFQFIFRVEIKIAFI